MARIEGDFPEAAFVYPTGHTAGPSDQVREKHNQATRDHVLARPEVLRDSADIESLDSGGVYCLETDGSCPCWCDTHPTDCLPLCGRCAHSHRSNCILKGRAPWWLSARPAGWDWGPTGAASGGRSGQQVRGSASSGSIP